MHRAPCHECAPGGALRGAVRGAVHEVESAVHLGAPVQDCEMAAWGLWMFIALERLSLIGLS